MLDVTYIIGVQYRICRGEVKCVAYLDESGGSEAQTFAEASENEHELIEGEESNGLS